MVEKFIESCLQVYELLDKKVNARSYKVTYSDINTSYPYF